jgi:hypothetical protein
MTCFVVSVVDKKQSTTLLLVLLAAGFLMNLIESK